MAFFLTKKPLKFLSTSKGRSNQSLLWMDWSHFRRLLACFRHHFYNYIQHFKIWRHCFSRSPYAFFFHHWIKMWCPLYLTFFTNVSILPHLFLFASVPTLRLRCVWWDLIACHYNLKAHISRENEEPKSSPSILTLQLQKTIDLDLQLHFHNYIVVFGSMMTLCYCSTRWSNLS